MQPTEFTEVKLYDDAFNAAVEAATEAHRAGLEPCFELEHGIQAYIFYLLTNGWIVAPRETE